MPTWLPRYLSCTRQPWACVLFVLPLLVVYEAGLYFIGASEERTGVDAWMRSALTSGGITLPTAAPLLLTIGLMLWGLLTPQQSLDDPLGAWIGMVVESVLFAGVLFGLVQLAFPLLAKAGGTLQESLSRFLDVSPGNSPEWTWAMIVRFLGAGIYEETLFRLVGFSLLRFVLLAGDVRPKWANVLAAIGSSVLFAAAHHVGSGQAHVDATVFLYRVMAGLYFAVLFQTRGFGVAVGAHAGYDVLVGLVLR